MKSHLTLLIATFFIANSFAARSFAQDKKDDGPPHELGFLGSQYLISNAKEILPAVGLRLSYGMTNNYLEAQTFGANAHGVSYYLSKINWRYEFSVQGLGAVYLLGADWHYFSAKSTPDYTLATGWHTGFGLNVKLSKRVWFRNDYILHLGFKRALSVSAGLSYTFGERN